MRPHPYRGFTLIEVLVTLAIVSILMVGVAGVVIGQSNAFELSNRTREAIASNRVSTALMERALRMASWGVDPALAFDFGVAGNPITRDRNDGPDELVFFARDPRFNRQATAVSANSVTLDAQLNRELLPGQILHLICPSGQGSAYVTVSTRANAGGGTGPTVSLRNATGVFPTQAPPTCAGEMPFVVKVDRYRFFMADVTDGAAIRPYLLLDQGLELVAGSRAFDAAYNRYTEIRDPTPGDGANPLTDTQLQNLAPVAAAVEDFQVAYLMNRPEAGWAINPAPTAPDTDTSWVFGDAGSSAEQPNPSALRPSFDDSYLDSKRFSAHPANIRSLRISLVTRSDKDVNRSNTRPAVENRAAAATADGFWRDVTTTNVYVRNMMSRSDFAPVQVGGGS